MKRMMVFGWLAISAGLAMGAAPQVGTGSSVKTDRPPAEKAVAGSQGTQEKLGIQVLAVHLSQGGNVLDLRYRVVDPAKAHNFLSSHVSPYLTDPSSGAKLTVPDMPYVGTLRQTAVDPLAGRVYFILFWNPGGAVKAGQKVNLVMGDATVAGIVVS